MWPQPHRILVLIAVSLVGLQAPRSVHAVPIPETENYHAIVAGEHDFGGEYELYLEIYNDMPLSNSLKITDFAILCDGFVETSFSGAWLAEERLSGTDNDPCPERHVWYQALSPSFYINPGDFFELDIVTAMPCRAPRQLRVDSLASGPYLSVATAQLPTAPVPGDMDGDRIVTLDDVPAFIDVLLDPSAASACAQLTADVNNDEAIDGRDIPLFVEAVLNAWTDDCNADGIPDDCGVGCF